MNKKAWSVVLTDAQGDIVVCNEGLSFWGGVDPDTGGVIDAHHPLCGQSLAGNFVLMPTSRGSCSGSGVLLQLALNGCAPAALVFREDEEVLTLGALIALHMFGEAVGVVRLSGADYDALALEASRGPGVSARLADGVLSAGDFSVRLEGVDPEGLALSERDRGMLSGAFGRPVALAMEVLCSVAASQGASRLIDVSRGHIDGCIYAHEANLIFAERMAEMGASVAVPTTINAISVDRENWRGHGLASDFGQAACRLADAYVAMGCEPTFTCAPYLMEGSPGLGEVVGWSESNAVIFANSVLGARTAKHPDYLDLFIALTGRAPETGVYLAENRRPGLVIEVEVPVGPDGSGLDDSFWPLLGWVAGKLAPDCVPVLVGPEGAGLEDLAPSRDDLRALCAAFGTTSASALLHVAGVTPEGHLEPLPGAGRVRVGRAELLEAWLGFNAGPGFDAGPGRVELVALGSPHFSLEETRTFAGLMAGAAVHPDVRVIVTLGREVRAAAEAEGLVEQLMALGVQFYSDLCWCSVVEPIFPPSARTLMTNSGKYAHYAPGLSGRGVRFGSLADCAAAAQTGLAPQEPPVWLR